ncbi:MAG TPA: hypothetical protein VK602_12605, partial [Phyllobacterium sp.]|nr:hypothetical protein [Phyllobacterium sp.]
KIREQLNSGIDATVAKREYELKLADLKAEADKRALESGVATSQEELKRIDAEARRYGDTKGRIEANNKALKDQKNLQDALISTSNKTDVINAELEAVNALGGAYDKLVYAQEKAAITAALMNKAREDGTEATAAEKASIEAVAEAQAKALATQAQYKEGQQAFKKAQDDNKQSAQQLADTYAGMATQFFTGFISDLKNGKSATEALSNAFGRLGDQLLDMALNMLFKNLFSGLMGGAGGGLNVFPGAPTMHGGGTVGMSRHMDGRRFNPLLWSGAPKFQAGGMVGLRPGEIPIIAHRGELVIPAGQTQQTGAVSGDDNRQYNIGIKVDSNGRANLTEGNGTVLGKKLNMAVQEVIAREQRSGGLLHGTGPGAR